MQNAEGRVQNSLTTEKAITMIDEYLQEPNNISREWVAVLELCRKALEENNDLFFKLQGVMLSVDKWIDGDELKQDEVNRAATMREKTLQITEKLEAEIERLNIRKKALTAITKNYDWKFAKAKSEAYKEFADRLTDIICDKIEESSNNPNGDIYYITDVYEDIDNLVKEMTEERDNA